MKCVWGPYKKMRLGKRHAKRKDYVDTQGDDGHLQAREPSEEPNLLTPCC